ncbi:MAG TPA: class I SAM-dependent methyltransferase [Mycobacteriales bacterium]|nr:class I SAM-dependent methyltransferase [Mycobacteriales bacterium]
MTASGQDVWEARRRSFGVAAANYAAGRPGYPREVLEHCLPDGARDVLDLAAGTGPLTAGLLELGLSVVAVEPDDEMRALIPPGAHPVAGTAEQIPLPDASVDAVFIGQAWHWFDVPRAVAEIHRVLRPGGVLAPMWNLFDADDPLTGVLGEVGPDELSTNMPAAAPPPFDAKDLFASPERIVTRYSLRYTRERVVALVSSMSVTILATPDERAHILDRVRAAMPDGEFDLSWVCEAWKAVRLPAIA